MSEPYSQRPVGKNSKEAYTVHSVVKALAVRSDIKVDRTGFQVAAHFSVGQRLSMESFDEAVTQLK